MQVETSLKLKPKQQINLCAHCNNLKKEMVSKHEKELTFTPPFHICPDRPIHNMDVHIQLILCEVLFKYSTSIIGYIDVPDIQLITKDWAISQIQ